MSGGKFKVAPSVLLPVSWLIFIVFFVTNYTGNSQASRKSWDFDNLNESFMPHLKYNPETPDVCQFIHENMKGKKVNRTINLKKNKVRSSLSLLQNFSLNLSEQRVV